MAADAASFAPPDLKRNLVKHRDRLMAGVTDAGASRVAGDAASRRAALARSARGIAAAIRSRRPRADVSYAVGELVHAAAGLFPPPPRASAADVADASRSARFLGYASPPFASPESLVAAPFSDTTCRQSYDASVTLTTRLLAWIWKEAGGDASIATLYPDSKGPYVVRD